MVYCSSTFKEGHMSILDKNPFISSHVKLGLLQRFELIPM